jgi:thiamine-phosphate pyrophosphorylase
MTIFADATGPITYLITDGSASDHVFEDDALRIQTLVSAAIEECVTLIQLREKTLSGKHLFELTSACARLTRNTLTKLLVNDRTDIAVGAGADGVHLTETSIPIAVIREKFGSDLLIGASVHSVIGAKAAAAEGADLAVYGPVFDTPEKGAPVGLDRLAEACSAVAPFPILGLGGIDPSKVKSVLEAGAAGIAAIRSFRDPEAIRSIMRSLRDE